jgi:hypothetical protein
MRLRELVEAVGGDLDREVMIGDFSNPQHVLVKLHPAGRIFLNTVSSQEPLIYDVIRDCRCSYTTALHYLEQCNWNVPLACVTYSREHGQKQTG